MPDITVSSEEIHDIEAMLASSGFNKLMQVAEADYQMRWSAAATTQEREQIWHEMKALQNVYQKLHDLVGGFKLQRKAQEARMRPSDAQVLRPPNGVDPLPFQE